MWTPGKKVKSVRTEMRLSLWIPRIKYAALHRARSNRPWMLMTILTHLAETQADMVTRLYPRMHKRAFACFLERHGPPGLPGLPGFRTSGLSRAPGEPQRSPHKASVPKAMVPWAVKLILLLAPPSAAVRVPPSPRTRGKSTLTLRVWIRLSAVPGALLQLPVARAETKCFVWFRG